MTLTVEAEPPACRRHRCYCPGCGVDDRRLGWVYAANQVIADDCSAVRLKLMRRMPDGDEEEVFKHEILDLLYNPNSIITSKQMWNLYFQYLNLTGEAYIVKLDRQGNPLTDTHKLPTALLPLPSHLCEFRLPTNEDFSQSTVNFNGENFPITAFLRDTNPDPENIYTGMSIVWKASLTIDADTEIRRWNNKLFKNGARPGAVLTSPNKLEEKTAKPRQEGVFIGLIFYDTSHR